MEYHELCNISLELDKYSSRMRNELGEHWEKLSALVSCSYNCASKGFYKALEKELVAQLKWAKKNYAFKVVEERTVISSRTILEYIGE